MHKHLISILPVNKVNLGISSVIPDVDEGVGYKGKNGDGVKCTTYADLRQHVGASRSRPSRDRLDGDSVPKEGRRQDRRVQQKNLTIVHLIGIFQTK